jgi:hypothetical protein
VKRASWIEDLHQLIIHIMGGLLKTFDLCRDVELKFEKGRGFAGCVVVTVTKFLEVDT